MRYVVAGLFSICLSLQGVAGVVAVSAQPAQRSWLLFVSDGKVWAVTSDGAETKGPLVTDESASGVYPSPDGRHLAAVTGGNDELRVFCLLPDFEVAEVEGPRPGLLQVRGWAWSPDGRYLAVTEGDGGLRIIRVLPHLDVAEAQALRPGLVEVWSCWWSPNGRYLTISTAPRFSGLTAGGKVIPPPPATPDDGRPCFGGVTRTEEAVLILPWHGDGKGLFDQPPLLSVPSGSVDWSPASDAVTYPRPTGNRYVSPDGICVTDVASGRTTQIQLAESRSLYHLSWSPDGRTLVYGGGGGIRSVPADGSRRASVLVDGEGQLFGGPLWSPDGTFLAYARSWGANGSGVPLMGLWILDTRSGASTRLTGDGTHVDWDSYRWSRDGTQLSFFAIGRRADDRPGDCALYVADPASGAVTRVAGGFPSLPSPAVWLPPGAPRGGDD